MICPTVLCGGSGTRLWPLSPETDPTQVVPMPGDEPLFQATAGAGAQVEDIAPSDITGAATLAQGLRAKVKRNVVHRGGSPRRHVLVRVTWEVVQGQINSGLERI